MPPSRIYVLAGCNGAGKSSLGGEAFKAAGVEVFDPDVAARRIRAANADRPAPPSQTEANAAAWRQGHRLLTRAIAEKLDFAFETTLGGEKMTELLERAAKAGIEVRVWYVGLASPELHVERVRRRVRKGGHDIPESDIRRRYDQSRVNLVRLLPGLKELRVFDNSAESDPDGGVAPTPIQVLYWRDRQVIAPEELAGTPGWAKPIVVAAVQTSYNLHYVK